MIILDTNFILICVKQKMQLFEMLKENFPEYSSIVPSNVIEELENLKEQKKLKLPERRAASLALQLIEKKNIRTIHLEGNVDDSIVSYALENKGTVIATLDRGVMSRLRGKARFLIIKEEKKISLV